MRSYRLARGCYKTKSQSLVRIRNILITNSKRYHIVALSPLGIYYRKMIVLLNFILYYEYILEKMIVLLNFILYYEYIIETMIVLLNFILYYEYILEKMIVLLNFILYYEYIIEK